MRQQGKTIEAAVNFYKTIGNAKDGDKMIIFMNSKRIELSVKITPREEVGRNVDFVSINEASWVEKMFMKDNKEPNR